MACDDYLSKHSHVAEAAKAVGNILADVQQRSSSVFSGERGGGAGALEVEGRLGRHTRSGAFDPNVGSAAFCSIVSMLESYDGWSSTSAWEETQDVFFSAFLPPGTLPPEDCAPGFPVQVRTTVSGGALPMEVTHIVKKKLQCVDLTLQSVDEGACALETKAAVGADFPLSARVATSMEWTVPAEILPVAVHPDLVRIKQRKKFFLSSSGVPGNCFSFETTIVYRGRTKSEAESQQRGAEGASFEVECECLAPAEYLQGCGGDLVCLGLSIVVKLLDFAAALNPGCCVTFVPIPVSTTRRSVGEASGAPPAKVRRAEQPHRPQRHHPC